MDYSDEALSYVYEVVRTVEFVLASDRVFRLEVVHCVKGTAHAHYAVNYYEQKSLYKAQDGTISPRSTQMATEFYVWVPDRNLPWVNQPSAEAALSQALAWLCERRNNRHSDW